MIAALDCGRVNLRRSQSIVFESLLGQILVISPRGRYASACLSLLRFVCGKHRFSKSVTKSAGVVKYGPRGRGVVDVRVWLLIKLTLNLALGSHSKNQ